MDRLVNNPAIDLLKNLKDTNEKLMERLSSVKDEAADLEDELEEVRKEAASLRAQADDAVRLAAAVRTYLSWKEQPPPSMAEDVYGEIERRFRYAVEEALRSVDDP